VNSQKWLLTVGIHGAATSKSAHESQILRIDANGVSKRSAGHGVMAVALARPRHGEVHTAAHYSCTVASSGMV
jgi:hypothetical protein